MAAAVNGVAVDVDVVDALVDSEQASVNMIVTTSSVVPQRITRDRASTKSAYTRPHASFSFVAGSTASATAILNHRDGFIFQREPRRSHSPILGVKLRSDFSEM